MSRSFPAPGFRRLALGTSAIALATALALPVSAQSFQGNATITFGAGNVTASTGTTNINVSSNSAVIDWTPFDTGIGGGNIAFQNAGTTATFTGPNANFAVLNRIVPVDTSRAVFFDGNVVSQYISGQTPVQGGTIFFYSPGGIVLGQNAVFDVGRLGLTTAPPVVDGNGGWYNGDTVQFGQSASGSGVFMNPGSQINAPMEGSYVAAFAPRVGHMGTINVNGQAALVSGEAGTITFSPNGLFDIQVSVGSDGDQNQTGLFVFGDITGPASSGTGDNHRIYLATIAKNNALTLSIQRGASLGFDIAGAANVDGNAIVLSAGFNISAGQIEQARAGTATSRISIQDNFPNLAGTGIDFTSFVTGSSSQSTTLSVVRQTNFASDLFLRSDGQTIVSLGATQDPSTGALTVAGDMTLLGTGIEVGPGPQDASLVQMFVTDGATAAIAGNLLAQATAIRDANNDGLVQANSATAFIGAGSALTVGGNLTFSANADSSALNTPTQATGGTAQINLDGGQLDVTGLTRLNAIAFSNGGAAANAGSASLAVQNGGTLGANGVGIFAEGNGGFEGGAGTGGNANFSVLSGSLASVGQLDIFANGAGGGRITAGNAGDGTGGNATLTVTNSSLDALYTSVIADGTGGFITTSAPANGSRSGNGVGGNAFVFLGGATVDLTILDIGSAGTGGFLIANNSTGLVAGNGNGGFAVLQGQAGSSTLNADFVSVFSDSIGGSISGGIGTGGNSTGVEARIDVLSGGALTINSDAQATMSAQGGTATDGTGGAAFGGRGYSFTSGGSLAINGTFFASSDALGGSGAVGGQAIGGLAYIQSSAGGSTTISGDASAFTYAEGGAGSVSGNGGHAGGTASGGNAQILASNGSAAVTIGGNAIAQVSAFGGSGRRDADGNGGDAGSAVGGLAEIGGSAGTGNTLTVGGSASISSSAYGGAGFATNGGDGGGARAYVSAGDGTALAFGSVEIFGQGYGGNVEADGSVLAAPGTRGGNGVSGDVRLRTFNTGGSISIAGDASLTGYGAGGGAFDTPGVGGTAQDNIVQVIARGGSVTVGGNLSINVTTLGGSGDVGANTISNFDTTQSGIFAQNGSVTVAGSTALSGNATGGSGLDGGAGGEAAATAFFLNPESSTAGASSITLGDLAISSFAFGGQGGDGSTGMGGRGGDAYSGSIVALGSAGNGTLAIDGAATLYTYALGGAGGASASSTGGAGGDAFSGYVQAGTKSGIDAGPVNNGSGSFTDLTIDSQALGGAGGASQSATGGAGGNAISSGGVLLVRGSPVTADSVSIVGYGYGGNGGSGATQGVGGYGAVNNVSLTATQRFQRTERGSADIGFLSLLAESIGGQGSVPGASYYAASGGISLTQSDVVLGDGNVLVLGDLPAPADILAAMPLELRLADATLAAGSVTFSTPGTFLLDLDSATMTAAELFITARDFVLPTTPPANPGTITVSDTVSLVSDPSGSVRTYANIISNGTASFSSGVDIFLGDIETGDDLFLTSLTGLITVGDVSAGSVGLFAQGTVSAGNVTADGSFVASSAAGAISVASVQASDVATDGVAGTTIGQIVAQTVAVSDQAGVTVAGTWTSPSILIDSADLDIVTTGALTAGPDGAVTLLARNSAGTFIGDGLSGSSGYRLTNAEFSRISGNTVQVGALDSQSNAVDLTIGALSLTNSQFPGESGSLSFGTGSGADDDFSVSGRIRVDGAVTGTGFSSSQSLYFATGSFELNAETGSIALAGQGFRNLGGIVEIEADNIHVASPSILAKLRENPRYTGFADELNAPATVQRPDGVLNALGLLFYPGDTLYIQNTGSAINPAGFLTTLEESDIEPPGFQDSQAPDVDVVINGRFATANGVISGRDVQGAITDGDADFSGISDVSSVNSCAFNASVCTGGLDNPQTSIQSEIALLSGETLAEEPFATEDAEEEEEAEKAAAAPVAPPVILINTRPLNPPLDIVEPISGSGNPAALVVTPAIPGENQP